jgi:hypothetical protein
MRSHVLAQLQPLLSRTTTPVILLEGTRQLPAEKRQALVDVGQRLAHGLSPGRSSAVATRPAPMKRLPQASPAVPGARLQLVLPTPGMGRSRRPASATCLALEDLPLAERHHLARESLAASPENHRLFDLYLRGQSGNPAYAKAQYLVRDALKVHRQHRPCSSHPATVALVFHPSTSTPTSGGTAHTVRLCERQEVPVLHPARLAWPDLRQ